VTLATILLTLVLTGPGEETETMDLDLAARRWVVVNDGVMGGVSTGRIRTLDDGTSVFSGRLSLENKGGFASVRCGLGTRDLSGYAGIRLTVRGDGRRYQLRLRTDERMDGVAYRAEFDTVADEWTSVDVPFDDFLPSFRGRILDGPPLRLDRVRQLGILLADKDPGPFWLEIGDAAAYRDTETGPDR